VKAVIISKQEDVIIHCDSSNPENPLFIFKYQALLVAISPRAVYAKK